MNTSRPTIGMGILSWRGVTSLDAALTSYQAAGLYNLFDERIIILPEPSEAMRAVVAKHPLRAYEFTNNLGIAGGMRAVAEALDTDYVLFFENDCPLIESQNEAKSQIDLSLQALHSGAAFMARLRSRRVPGEPFNSLPKYLKYWDDTSSARLRRTLRPIKARHICGRAVYAIDEPHKRHPNYIREYISGTYIVSPKALPWTNLSILMKRRDFLDVIMPFVESHPTKRRVNGFRNIEIELNRSRFWTRSNFDILCPPGIFTHSRIDDRGYS